MQQYRSSITEIVAHLHAIRKEISQEMKELEKMARKYDALPFPFDSQEAEEADAIGMQMDVLDEQLDAIDAAIDALQIWK